MDSWVESNVAATAAPASAAVGEKGLRRLINARSSILLRWADVSGVDYQSRERTAEAVVDARGKLHTVERGEQVEVSGVVPLMHDGEAIEQRHVVLLRDHPHVIQIRRHRNHGFSAWTIFQI